MFFEDGKVSGRFEVTAYDSDGNEVGGAMFFEGEPGGLDGTCPSGAVLTDTPYGQSRGTEHEEQQTGRSWGPAPVRHRRRPAAAPTDPRPAPRRPAR